MGRSLVKRVRELLPEPGFIEKPFLGGRGFYWGDELVVAVIEEDLVVREAPGHAHEVGGVFEFAGRPVAGWWAIPAGRLDKGTLEAMIGAHARIHRPR